MRVKTLLAAGLLLLGGCARQVGHVAVPTTSPSTEGASPSSATADPYVGWRVYRSSWEGASFKYPADWTAKTLANFAQGGPHGDGVTLTSPDGLRTTWLAPVYGLGGDCDAATSPHIFIDRIFPLRAVAARPLAIVLASIKGHKTLSVVDDEFAGGTKIGDTHECLVYPLFHSRAHKDYTLIRFSPVLELENGAGTNDVSDKLTDDAYLAQPAVKTLMMIYRSFHF